MNKKNAKIIPALKCLRLIKYGACAFGVHRVTKTENTKMTVYIGKDKLDMAAHAAKMAGDRVREAIALRGGARIIVATGASQFEFLEAFVEEPGIDWTKVEGFHLDEYVGLPATHKASFRGYMRERFVAKTPQPLKAFNEVNGEAADPDAEIARLEALLRAAPGGASNSERSGEFPQGRIHSARG